MQKNKINIIFLDVDGVLNSRAYLNNHKDPEDEIDMRAVERLAKIYRQCNCKIRNDDYGCNADDIIKPARRN